MGTNDKSYNAANQEQQGGAVWSIGGQLDIDTSVGGKLTVGGVDVTNAVATGGVAGVAAGYKIARGQATTASASDTIVTGLATVVAAIAQLDAGPVVGAEVANASIGDQAGTPAAGSILIETWKTLGGTPAAATTFSVKVNWIAIGT
jgi:hypothetical protein